MDDIESTIVTLTVRNLTDTSPVTATSDHNSATGVELDEVGDLASLKVKLHSVVHPDEGIRVANGASVVGDDEGDALCANSKFADLAEFVGSLLGLDTVDGETTLYVVKETEVFARAINGQDV